MVASENDAKHGIYNSNCSIFVLKNTCCAIKNHFKKDRTKISCIQSIISLLSFAILILSLIDDVESSSQNCHSKHNKQKNETIAAFSAGEKTDLAKIVQSEDHDWNLCLSAGCVASANAVLDNMNRKLDPCDNFYEFACGKFVEETRIPDDKSSVTAFSVIDDKLQEQLRDILDQPISPQDIKPFVYAKNLFSLCMNRALIEKKGASTVSSLLKEVGGWPVVEGSNWKEADWEWKKSVYTFREKGLGIDYFLGISVGPDLKKSTTRRIIFDQAALGLNREFLVKGPSDKLVAAYYDYMVDIAALFGADKNAAKNELRKSLDFEINLANISLPREKRRDRNALYDGMTLPHLKEKYPSIPWEEYLKNLLPGNIQLKRNEWIITYDRVFIQKLEALMKNTPKRVQANYAFWRVARESVRYLSDDFRRRQLKYGAVLSGRTEAGSRWRECTQFASSGLTLAVGSQYVQKFFKEDSKKIAVELVRRVRMEMYKTLEHVEWMDEKTRATALEKAKAMTTHIAYPDELLDDKKLIEFYKKLEIGTDDYYVAALNMTKFATEFRFSRLRDPVNKTEWIAHGRPAIVNAFYNSIENSIQFPAGILQGVFFNKNRPHYMNYGGVGFIIGHEITHGFDDQGRQFNKDGNLEEWWQQETKKKYLEKAKCIIDQYGNYTATQVNMKLNGINTQGENIADNGGIKLSYYAYREWVRQNGPEPRLPGLQMFSPQQMFWISAAKSWCLKIKDEELKMRITTGVHSPGEFRVIGPLSNLKEFAQDFGCPTGSKMNPQHKCTVW
ncbi:neprilysin-2 [Nilaparvata lugens]|uniref:neprilysin-2 n=1 Tax=Nilaparvata lugens TaxID=108931 RepID=UPI00193DED31|nr:neprilysin-2 [Nilaparvata lugens]